MATNPNTLWPAAFTTQATPDTGNPGTGSYGNLTDPVPQNVTSALAAANNIPAQNVSGSTWDPISGTFIANGPGIPYTWKILIGLLAVLLIVAGGWVILNG